jgi:riboflavin kinase/FMN adenylyltransferase
MARSTPATFTAHVVSGRQRGRTIGTPTINLNVSEVPSALPNGIYACFARFVQGKKTGPKLPAVMHYGPRPVFEDSVSCEVHLLDRVIAKASEQLTVTVVEYIRDIIDYPVREVLQDQIKSDIAVAREILGMV